MLSVLQARWRPYLPRDGHPLYAAWLRAFDRMIDAEEAWALARMERAPNEDILRLERDNARDAYFMLVERL
jgi:hypothetical protein